MSLLKYKHLSCEELIINLDRLSRFKLPEDSYNKVFQNIILKYLISPKFSRNEIETMDAKSVSKIVKTIWNSSVKNLYPKTYNNIDNKNLLKFLIKNSFKNIDNETEVLINTDLNISPILNNLNFENSVYNLKFLIKANNIKNYDYTNIRKTYSLKYPLKKIVIVEGITEEILLPVFAKKLGFDFDKEGILLIGAGGKSKSPTLYMQYRNKVKIPIILMFDSDAKEIADILKSNMLKKDAVIIIKEGEFEDILSLNLIKRTINKEYLPAVPVSISELKIHNKMCENIENIYKSRNVGEFKKSKFSKIIAKNVKYQSDITSEIKNIVYNIINI